MPVLFISLFLSGLVFSVEIACPIPQGDFYIIQTAPHPVSREKIINSLFGNKPYAMSLSMNYSVFRKFYNKEGTIVVETGFPNYTGISYDYEGFVDSAYFIFQLNKYFSVSNIVLPGISQKEVDGKTLFRTASRMIDGAPVLFDDTHAGDGAEMTVENRQGVNHITIKYVWHDVTNKIKITNTVDIAGVVRNSGDLSGKTVVQLENCYYYSAEDEYRPCVKATAADGFAVYLDILSGQSVPKYRELTGR